MSSGAARGVPGSAPVPVAGRAAPFLAARGICKRFGKIPALDGIDLEVAADELLVVLGPTGAGKTTLLRTLAGLERPDAGTIAMAGRDVTGWDPASRDVALVFQNFSLYPRWTVRKNLEFPLKAPGRSLAEAEIRRRIEWAAELLNITRYLDREASRLSGGEMQRVAIGRAIVRRPRLFLLDEPLTNLDAKLREALRVELVQLRRQLGAPMIFVTHDQAEALSMADRIVVLSEGRIQQVGTPREIYEHPVSKVVALQLGQPAINLLRVRRELGQWLATDGTPLLPAHDSGPAERVLGIRPEHIELDGGDTASDGIVRIVEYIGPTTTILIDWAGQHVHVLVPRRATVRPGARVRPHIDAARAVLFEPDAPRAVSEPAQQALLGGASLRERDPSHPIQPASHHPTKEMP